MHKITNDQRIYGIAGLADGGFVIVWHSDGQDGSFYGVYMQMFDIWIRTEMPTVMPSPFPTRMPSLSPTIPSTPPTQAPTTDPSAQPSASSTRMSSLSPIPIATSSSEETGQAHAKSDIFNAHTTMAILVAVLGTSCLVVSGTLCCFYQKYRKIKEETKSIRYSAVSQKSEISFPALPETVSTNEAPTTARVFKKDPKKPTSPPKDRYTHVSQTQKAVTDSIVNHLTGEKEEYKEDDHDAITPRNLADGPVYIDCEEDDDDDTKLSAADGDVTIKFGK